MFCAKRDEWCRCKGGEVRFGRKTTEQEVWTYPTLIGDEPSVRCTLPDLQRTRVQIPARGSNNEEVKQCQCIERVMRISTTVMSFLQIRDSSELQIEDHSSRRVHEDRSGAEEDEDGLERIEDLESLVEEENVNDYTDMSNGNQPS